MHLIYKQKDRQRGVSLLEVLISIVVIAIGILGLAKMQALAISNTQVSGNRGLIALQASNLASLMHGNPGFWQSTTAPACAGASACTLSGVSLAKNPGTPFVTSLPTCNTVPAPVSCNAGGIASLDINAWMGVLYAEVPSYSANINCSAANGSNSCLVSITWVEKLQGMNQTTAGLAAKTGSAGQSQQYYLSITP